MAQMYNGHAVMQAAPAATPQADIVGVPGDYTIYNGTFTLNGPRDHRTFEIETVRPPTDVTDPHDFSVQHAGKRILKLMVGPDNETSYRGLGWMQDDGTVKLWAWGKSDANRLLTKVFLQFVVRGQVPMNYAVLESRSCRKCNRKLTTPESIARGIGPICAEGGLD